MTFHVHSLILHFARPSLTRKALPVALRRWFRFSPAALVALMSVLLTGCTSKDPQDTFSPDSPIARDIYNLAVPVFLIAAAMGVFVFALIFICAVKFRRKSEDHVPKQVHGNTAMEIGWTAAPALLLAVIGVFSVGAIFDQANDPKDSINITVAGHQWWWEFHYPVAGQEKLQTTLETVDDPLDLEAAKEEGRAPKKIANYLTEGTPVVVNANELHIPAGRNIRMTVTSQDVIHSFWVPKLAGKIDAVPGKLNHLNINSDPEDAGKVFYAQCAEFCGASHADMRFKVHVDSPAQWQQWLKDQADTAAEATGDPETDLVAQGQALFQGGAGCVVCHYTESDKVNDVGIVGKIGPNLAHVGSRTHFAGAIALMSDANLKAWLRDPQGFKPGSRMVVRKFTEDEVLALVAYIKSLK